MAIKVNGTTVIDDNRNLVNIVSGAGSSTTYGAVGTYAVATYQIGGSTIMGGGTVAGSTLYYYWQPDNTYPDATPFKPTIADYQNVSSGFSGTWRLMAGRMTSYSGQQQYYTGLWVRIS